MASFLQLSWSDLFEASVDRLSLLNVGTPKIYINYKPKNLM